MKKAAILAAAAAILLAAVSACAAEQYIGEAKAKEIALKHAGVPQQAASFTKMKFEQEYGYGRTEYELVFLANGVRYEYEIDAVTGRIYEFSAKSTPDFKKEQNASGSQISEAEAKKIIASRFPGAAEKDIKKFKKIYECEVEYDDKDYEIRIDAETGEIIKWEMDD